MRLGPCISVAFTILCAIGAARAEPTAAHVAAVKTAQQSNYIAATDCSAADTDVHGWAKDSLLECVYEKGPTHLKAQVFLVVIEPKVIASWIETTCAERLPGFSGCFKRVLECGRLNSGMMFPAAGNLLEDMGGGPWKNYFFRHGMTVRMSGQPNGTTTQIPLQDQVALTLAGDDEIERIPSGLTRFWRTRPEQFANAYPEAGAPTDLDSPEKRAKWMKIAADEFRAAMAGSSNRLLSAYVAAHPNTLAANNCPNDSDP